MGGGVFAAIIALGGTYLGEPTYEATALVALSEPRARIQFDPRIDNVTEVQPLAAYPELSLSDELLKIVFFNFKSC